MRFTDIKNQGMQKLIVLLTRHAEMHDWSYFMYAVILSDIKKNRIYTAEQLEKVLKEI